MLERINNVANSVRRTNLLRVYSYLMDSEESMYRYVDTTRTFLYMRFMLFFFFCILFHKIVYINIDTLSKKPMIAKKEDSWPTFIKKNILSALYGLICI